MSQECGENIPPLVYAEAWRVLYSTFGEHMQQDELDLMDSVLSGVKLEMQDEMERFEIADILKRFPHLSGHLGRKEKE